MAVIQEDPLADLLTVLVVENDVLIRLDVSDYLRRADFRVLEVSNPREAIALLQSDVNIDLVFSDVQTGDGFELARWVRQHLPGVQLIVTSASMSVSEVAAALPEGVPLLMKPYRAAELEREMRSLLLARRQH